MVNAPFTTTPIQIKICPLKEFFLFISSNNNLEVLELNAHSTFIDYS